MSNKFSEFRIKIGIVIVKMIKSIDFVILSKRLGRSVFNLDGILGNIKLYLPTDQNSKLHKCNRVKNKKIILKMKL